MTQNHLRHDIGQPTTVVDLRLKVFEIQNSATGDGSVTGVVGGARLKVFEIQNSATQDRRLCWINSLTRLKVFEIQNSATHTLLIHCERSAPP